MSRSTARLRGLRLAFDRIGAPALFGLLPVAVLAWGTFLAARADAVALDFRGELYPQAQIMLDGGNPFPPADADLSSGVNRIFPVPAALLVAPLTAVGALPATILWSGLLVVGIVASLLVLGVRDWRVFGVVFGLWSPTFAAVQTGNLTVALALLAALAWRLRSRRLAPGIAIGLAVALKLFVWPLVIWLAATRRWAAAAVASAIGALGTLLILPYMSLRDYAALMGNLAGTFGDESYNVSGLLFQLGFGSGGARAVALAAGSLLLVLVWRRRSFPLAIAACLVLSPIVWLHYFLLIVVAIATRQPRLAPIWFLGIGLIGAAGNGADVTASRTVLVLAVATTAIAWLELRPTRQSLRRLLAAPAAERGGASAA